MSSQLSADTMKGHGLSKATVVDFYGLGKDGVPSEQPTRCMVGRVGNSYMLTSLTGEIHTWEFGAATKVYAAKVDTAEVLEQSTADRAQAYVEAMPQAPKAEVVRVDAVEVTGAKVENIKWLGMVPESLTSDPSNRLAYGDYNLYVRWSYEGGVRVDRSDDDRMIVANSTRGGKVEAFKQVMISLATFYGVPVVVAADPGVKVGAHLAKMLGTYLPRDGKPTVAPAYQACDTVMVAGEPMWIIGRTQDAQGWLYEVRELGGDADSERFDVRESEMSPYVLTPRVDMVTATPVEPVTLPLNTYVEITEGDAAGWTYSVTRFDEFWVGLRKVGTFRDGRNIRTDSFRAGLADGSVKVVKIVPTPTVEDVAAMVGDPVGWVNGLMSDAYASDGRSLAEVIANGDMMAPTETTVVALFTDEATIVAAVGDTVYRERDGHQGTITHVDGRDVLTLNFAGGLEWSWRVADLISQGYEVIPAAEVAQGEAMALVTADGDAWHVLEREIWAGTDTMRQPMRTKVNKRSRKAAKRSKRHSLKRGA